MMSVASPMDRRHEPGGAGLVAHGSPGLADADLEHRIAHHRPGPDAIEQRFLGDEMAVVLDQARQSGKGLRRQANLRRARHSTALSTSSRNIGKCSARDGVASMRRLARRYPTAAPLPLARG